MRYWLVTTPIEHKNGEVVLETMFVADKEQPDPMAVEVPRLPSFGESWDGTKFVKDKALIDAHKEETRLGQMTAKQLFDEIMAKVASDLPRAEKGTGGAP